MLIAVSLIVGITGCAEDYFCVTISSTTGGSVTSPGEGKFRRSPGTVLNLTASAERGYRFVEWAGEVETIFDVYAATTNMTVDDDYSIRGNFVAMHDLTIASIGQGSVTEPGEGVFTYDEGTVVDLTAEADEGYSFIGWTGDIETIDNVNAAITTVTMTANCTVTAYFGWWSNITQVAAGGWHTVGVRSDHTVAAVGWNSEGQCDVGDWTGITQVAAGDMHTVGLKSDGTVVAVGYYVNGECPVGNWTGITRIAAGGSCTVGLRFDGTVVNTVGLDTASWEDITEVTVGNGHIVGLKSDGTVVAVGDDGEGQCEVGSWTEITQVAAGAKHTVGLKSDGTVFAVGWNVNGQCDLGSWIDIAQVAAGDEHTVGLENSGRVFAVGQNVNGQCNVGGWTDCTEMAAGFQHTVGLRLDGTVFAVGLNEQGQCDV